MRFLESIFKRNNKAKTNIAEKHFDYNGFISTLERELCTAVNSELGDETIVRDEVFSIFCEGLGDQEPTMDLLSNLDSNQLTNITMIAQKYAEDIRITEKHIQVAVRVTLHHWEE